MKIKAVPRIEKNLGYELATVLISSFCRDLLIKVIASGACYQRDARTPDAEPPAVSARAPLACYQRDARMTLCRGKGT